MILINKQPSSKISLYCDQKKESVEQDKKPVFKNKITLKSYYEDAKSVLENDDIGRKTRDMSSYNKVLKQRGKRRMTIVANLENKNVELVDDAFFNMTLNERIFFTLYNSVDYYDNEFGGKTYLNAVLCYLIAFCKYNNEVNDYGYFVSGMNCVGDNEYNKRNKKESSGEYGMKHFRFNDVACYSLLKNKANKVLNNTNFIRATKELVNHIIDDPENARADCILGVKNLIKETDSDKVKLEAYKLLGIWLGIEKPVKEVNTTVVFKSIDNALASEDFLSLVDNVNK